MLAIANLLFANISLLRDYSFSPLRNQFLWGPRKHCYLGIDNWQIYGIIKQIVGGRYGRE